MTKEKYELTSPQANDKGEIKIDDKKKIKEMDIVSKEGPMKDKTIPAIYEFDGEMLRVCFSPDGMSRPTDFKTSKENGNCMAVYSKVRK
jgi:uncharacterized protein (TIGR03067 family)